MRQITLIEAIAAVRQQKKETRAKGLQDFLRHTEQVRSKRRPPDIKPPPTTIY